MAHSRRKALSIIGGGLVLAAAPAGAFLATRTPKRALQPWDLAGSYKDVRLNALSFALLAPNPHNLQPWQVELLGDDGIRLHRDTSRGLPETDPFDRQITIGMGCFLEQMVLAAGAAEQAVDLTLFPDGAAGPVAEARFAAGGAPDPLSAAIMDRRSCKEPFELRDIEAEKLAALAPLAALHTDAKMVADLRDLTTRAWIIEAYTPRTMQESIDVMRIGKAEINANPDGIDLGGPLFDSLKAAGMLTRESLADPESTNFKEGERIYAEMLAATPAFVSLATDGNTRADQIEAGRRWLRLNLQTTLLGLSLHPVSQCLQEYPEMEVEYAKAHAMLAKAGQTVQMLGRLGYGPTVPRTPRWPLEAKRIG